MPECLEASCLGRLCFDEWLKYTKYKREWTENPIFFFNLHCILQINITYLQNLCFIHQLFQSLKSTWIPSETKSFHWCIICCISSPVQMVLFTKYLTVQKTCNKTPVLQMLCCFNLTAGCQCFLSRSGNGDTPRHVLHKWLIFVSNESVTLSAGSIKPKESFWLERRISWCLWMTLLASR